MATQLQVVHSATFEGAGVIAAGPYDCGQGNIIGVEACDLGIAPPTLEQQAVTWAGQGRIDSVSNLQHKPVYTFHGTLDPVVDTALADAGVSFCRHFGADTTYHSWDAAGHSWSPRTVRPSSRRSPPL